MLIKWYDIFGLDKSVCGWLYRYFKNDYWIKYWVIDIIEF